MGLFRKRLDNGVRGTARVVSISRPPHAATHGNLRMTVVVEAPGIPAYSHVYNKLVVRVAKWPSPGDVVPVNVDPGDPGQIEVLVGRDADQPRQRAARRGADGGDAAPTAGGRAGGGSGGGGAAGGGRARRPAAADVPGAVVQVGGDPVQAPRVVASQSDADPVERLEKLARLRDAGIVDQEQFEQLRAQILDQAGLDDT